MQTDGVRPCAMQLTMRKNGATRPARCLRESTVAPHVGYNRRSTCAGTWALPPHTLSQKLPPTRTTSRRYAHPPSRTAHRRPHLRVYPWYTSARGKTSPASRRPLPQNCRQALAHPPSTQPGCLHFASLKIADLHPPSPACVAPDFLCTHTTHEGRASFLRGCAQDFFPVAFSLSSTTVA